jgi:hypothetical protein
MRPPNDVRKLAEEALSSALSMRVGFGFSPGAIPGLNYVYLRNG